LLAGDRQRFEAKLKDRSVDHWLEYIRFEISEGHKQRAHSLFLRALASSIEIQTNVQFWSRFVTFMYTTMKAEMGMTNARIMFEQKLQNDDSKFLNPAQKIEVLLENAKFEEIAGNSLRARKIYE
jgi:hypothetical protein